MGRFLAGGCFGEFVGYCLFHEKNNLRHFGRCYSIYDLYLDL